MLALIWKVYFLSQNILNLYMFCKQYFYPGDIILSLADQ
eukprot:SAG11_NODE_906_length_6600_cov_8.505461_1_plen_39_part_00